LLALAAMTAYGADPKPGAAVAANGALTITLPADLLRSAEVRDQLTSGLTTVFVVSVSASDGRVSAKGGARIDVRFALWEEQYVVSLLEGTGQQRRLIFDSEAAFARWWIENPLTVTPPRGYGQGVDVQVTLKMLPFSAQEQSDTRRWLSGNLSANASEATKAQSAEILRIIVETSVRRRPLLERQWSVRTRREGTP
jgi:hypothetical protein